MRVALVYNQDASNAMPAADVRRAIEGEGHRVVVQLAATEDVRRALTGDLDLVAVAGGDGTMRGVALQTSGYGIPLAVIPLGTANNIAASLGWPDGEVRETVRAWRAARRTPFDLGVARGSWGERRFLESAGAGLVAHGIAVMDSEAPHPEEGDRFEMLRKAVRRFADVLDDVPPRRCRLSLDGEECEQDLLLVEVLNTPSVGPRLVLAPASHPASGSFDVVTVEEAQRTDLARYLRERARERPAEIHLPTRRAARVALEGWDTVHVDERVLAGVAGTSVTMEVERAALEVLAAPAP